MAETTACNTCGGDGKVDPNNSTCPTCGGSGRLPATVKCPTCLSIGYVGDDVCPTCFGGGLTPVTGLISEVYKKLADVEDKVDDALDKLNDIKEIVDEL
jgi:DnaJ-class molecular chaperone